MAAKRTHRPRAIPAQHVTWSEREAAAAAARVEYVADLDGIAPNMYWVIRRRETGEIIEEYKTVTASEVEARIAVLNRGKPTRAENQSWGKLTKERARAEPGDKLAVKSADPRRLSATEWFEYLVGPLTASALQAYVPAGPEDKRPALTLAALKRLMRQAGGNLAKRADGEMLDAVSRQLWVKLGIRRSDEGRLDEYNSPDSW